MAFHSSRRGFLKSTLGVVAATAVGPVIGADPPAKYVEVACRQIALPCGRRLACAEFGEPAPRHTVFYHHGIPSCRLGGAGFACALQARPGVRLIAMDLPGIGRSDPDPCGTFLTWPADLAALASAYQVDRFGVIGGSAGAPFALAAARALPDRVTLVSLAAPMTPFEIPENAQSEGAREAFLATRHPLAARIALNRFIAPIRRNPDRLPISVLGMPPADRAVLNDPAILRLYNESTIEAFSQGADSVIHLATLLTHPWSCWLKDVKTKVTIFQGCADRVATPTMARYMLATLPNATLTLVPGEGHISLSRKFAAEILDAALPAK